MRQLSINQGAAPERDPAGAGLREKDVPEPMPQPQEAPPEPVLAAAFFIGGLFLLGALHGYFVLKSAPVYFDELLTCMVIQAFTLVLAFAAWYRLSCRKIEHAAAHRIRAGEKRSNELLKLNMTLSERLDAAEQQIQTLSALNGELIAMQSELESGYYRMEEENRQLEAQATTDPLTGLMNRRALQQHLRVQIALALRQGHPLSLLMIDADHFKRYNDRFGHPAGDQALRGMGEALQHAVRESDLAARYGGEEFVALLPHAGVEEAVIVAERIRAAIQTYAFDHEPITVSIGVATLPVHARNPGQLVQMADMALYRAKLDGRNRVRVAEPRASGDTTELSDPSDEQEAMEESDRAAGKALPPRTGYIRSFVIGADCFGGLEGLLQEPAGIILQALLAMMDLRDVETVGHSQRVARYAIRLAEEMMRLTSLSNEESVLPLEFTPGDRRALAVGALLHDIGKLNVPDHLLRKRGSLTEEEWAVIRRHAVSGVEMISQFSELAAGAPVVRSHHERWDGNGYPDHLQGEAIPLLARIFAVADAFDAMTSDRPYRAAISFAEAAEEIARFSGSQFDPRVVKAFLMVSESEWHRLQQNNADVSLRAVA
jgi:diguanylate cyclase (GGDEF)-like protein/putative nucleotidyltransferase with HDIG domain